VKQENKHAVNYEKHKKGLARPLFQWDNSNGIYEQKELT
jgi:hypothetical protein